MRKHSLLEILTIRMVSGYSSGHADSVQSSYKQVSLAALLSYLTPNNHRNYAQGDQPRGNKLFGFSGGHISKGYEHAAPSAASKSI